MKFNRFVAVFIVLVLAVIAAGSGAVQAQSYTVTDVTGREVEFAAVPEKVIAIGHGALKMYTFIAGPEKIVGLENAEVSGHSLTSQSIHYAFPELRELPVVGKGGPKFEPDYELLTFAEPDVVFIAYENTKEELDEIQSKINVPVVGINMGKSGQIFGNDTVMTFEVIGKTMGIEARAKEVIDFLAATKEDLTTRTDGLEESPTTYLGGASFRGAQGILSTKTKIDLFNTVNALNVMDALVEERSVIIDKEKLLEIDPELIILDLSGKALLDEDMSNDPEFYRSLQAFKNQNAYYILPYFTYGMNYDTALLNMYFIGSLVHPEAFADLDLAAKAAEIYTVFVGKDVYQDLMAAFPEGFKESGFGHE